MELSKIVEGVVIGVSVTAIAGIAYFLNSQNQNLALELTELRENNEEIRSHVARVDALLSSFARVEDGKTIVEPNDLRIINEKTIELSESEYREYIELRTKYKKGT